MTVSRRLEAVVILVAFTVVCLLPGVSHAGDPSTLRIGLLPDEAAQTVIRLNEPLRADLERRLHMPVEVIVGTDYAATVEALRFGRIDIAYLGPVTYVLGRERAEIEPFAKPMHAHGATFRAVIITAADSPVKSLADLRDKSLAFGDVASTSGHWVPRYMLHVAGLNSGVDYHPQFLGSHDAVALAVSHRIVAAGGLSEPIFKTLVAAGKIDPTSVRVIAESPQIPEYVWTFRVGLSDELRRRVTDAFLGIHDPDVLNVFQARGFVPAHDEDYQIVRDWLWLLRKGGT
ncbi:MAG: phosphonate transport system substrate-binding protein [Rhodospirillaceae bacterium]|jgi:phosphonate transport system substrate-binding protein|nr:phosphonate transport system substrate-binding protein [Rhodospirillaceae bacterium]